MRFIYILDNILGQRSKVKILRFLTNYRRVASIRELARETRITPPNVSRILKELEREGALSSKKIGNSIVFSLNKGNFLVDKIIIPLFKEEAHAKKELNKKIISNIKFPVESIILFGSLARGEEKSGSDIDIAFVVKDSLDIGKIEKEILLINPSISGYFGNTIAPVVIKKSDFIKKLKKGDHFISAIAREGEVISGKLINDLL